MAAVADSYPSTEYVVVNVPPIALSRIASVNVLFTYLPIPLLAHLAVLNRMMYSVSRKEVASDGLE